MKVSKSAITNIKFVLYVLIFGFFMFLFGKSFEAVFIPTVPLSSDFCLDMRSVDLGEGRYFDDCYEFKNEFEKNKFYHNQEMSDRKQYLVVFNILISTAVTFVLIYFFGFLHQRSGKDIGQDLITVFFVSLFLGGFPALIMPLAYDAIIKDPDNFLPEFILDVRDSQVQYLLYKLEFEDDRTGAVFPQQTLCKQHSKQF